MNRTHTQATWLARAMGAGLVLVVVVAWHVAVVATTSARLVDPRAGVLALRALIEMIRSQHLSSSDNPFLKG